MIGHLRRLRRWYFGVLFDGARHRSDVLWTELYRLHLADEFDNPLYQHTLLRFRVAVLFAYLFSALGGIEYDPPLPEPLRKYRDDAGR